MYALPGRWQGSTDPEPAAHLLSDPEAFRHAALPMLAAWPSAAVENLRNPSINQRAWLGQASACHALGLPAFVTKVAWGLLSTGQHRIANATADAVIEEWRGSRRVKTLFD